MPKGARVALRHAVGLFAICLAGSVALLAPAALRARATVPADVVVVPLPYAGPGVGGWSGIDVAPNGLAFWAVTDRGRRAQGKLLRNRDGTLTGVDAAVPVWLPGMHQPRIGEHRDAEGLDVRPDDGQAYVSFEGWARLRTYRRTWDKAHWRPDPPATTNLHSNRGFEAVARDGLGRLYTLPEQVGRLGAPYPLYRFTRRAWMSEADWQIATLLSSAPGWRAVGADFGPDGAFYLLERRFGFVGFGNRIRRFDVLDATPDQTLKGEVVFQSPLGQHGNLEGLAIWLDNMGQLRALMVTDDNERWFQRAELIEVRLGARSTTDKDPLASAGAGQ